MNRFHIGVGNNSFPLVPGNDLRGCINDAHHMAATLDKRFSTAIEAHVIENSTRKQFGDVMELAITVSLSF